MYSLDVIKKMNEEAAKKAERNAIEPTLIVREEEVDEMPPFPFPMIGDKKVELARIETLFCDSSGFGMEGERALSISQLKKKLKEMIRDHGPIRVAVVEAGQFQVYLDVWRAEIDAEKKN